MRKPTLYIICENKDADQLRGNREADQRLCFRCTDSTFPLLSKSEILSLVCVGPGLKPERWFSYDEAQISICMNTTTKQNTAILRL